MSPRPTKAGIFCYATLISPAPTFGVFLSRLGVKVLQAFAAQGVGEETIPPIGIIVIASR